MVEHPERILQSHDWDVQILHKRSSKERDETPACTERTEDALAITVSFLFELCLGLAQPFEEETEARIQRAQIGLFDFLRKSAVGSLPKFEIRRGVGRETKRNSGAFGWAGAATRLATRALGRTFGCIRSRLRRASRMQKTAGQSRAERGLSGATLAPRIKY